MEKKGKSISVVGCGWLGLAFSKLMIEEDWKVKGSTTTKEKVLKLESIGIEAFLLKLPLAGKLDPLLFEADYLLVNFPPGRGNLKILTNYPYAINQLIHEAKKVARINKIIFISSTSVYGDFEELCNEDSATVPTSDSGKAILQCEKIVREFGLPFVILRFGGLAGPKRHPGRFLAGRKGLNSGNQSVNFLHLEDAIGIIRFMIDHPIENEIFNVVAPGHPGKEDFYTKMATSIGLISPTFIKNTDQRKKEISVDKLLNDTSYQFKYPDPMTFKY